MLAIKKKLFSFGENWFDYAKNYLDQEKIEEARASLLRYLPEEGYKDKVFIDIGCGSGIFSLGALNIGCRKTVSVDVDKNSVNTALMIRDKYCNSALAGKWEIMTASILDDSLAEKLSEEGDIVYSWGVLHHTGNMVKAIENVCKITKKGGYLIIAIYNKAPSSEFWLKVKRFYNFSPIFFRKFLNYFFYAYGVAISYVLVLKNLILKGKFILPEIKKSRRGMSVFYNIIDWIGGYPYEYASFDEVKDLVEKHGFKLVDSPTKLPSPRKNIFNRFTFAYTANNEFVFQKL